MKKGNSKKPQPSETQTIAYRYDKLELFSDVSSVGLFSFNKKGLIKSCSSKFAILTGYSIDDIVDQQDLRSFIFEEDVYLFDSCLGRLLNSNLNAIEEILRFKKKDGSVIKVKLNLSKSSPSSKYSLNGKVIEVSESKSPESSFNILSLAANYLNEAIIITDLSCNIFYTNEPLNKLLGYNSGEMIGKYANRIFEEFISQQEFDELFVNSSEKSVTKEFVCSKKDGTHILVSMKSELIKDEKDFPIARFFILNDMSDQERVLGELRRSEFRYNNLLKRMHDAFAFIKIIADKNGKPVDIILIDTNEAFGKVMQEPISELMGKTFSSRLERFRDVRPHPFQLISQSALEQKEGRFEFYDKQTDTWYLVLVYAPEKGYAFLIIHDITKVKKAQEELNNSQNMLRSIIDNIPQRVFWKDTNSKFLGCNIHFAKDLGLKDPGEIVGKSEYDFSDKDVADKYVKADKYIIENARPISISDYKQLVNHESKKISVRLNKLPLINENNEIIGVVGTYEDISKQKAIEENLRKLSQAVEQSPVSIVITDLKGNIEYVNNKFNQVTGYSAEEVIGKNPRILKSGKTSSEEYKNLWETIASGNEWRGEFHNKKKNGELYWESASISPIKDTSGNITHFLAVKEDITERKRIEESIRESERLLREIQAITNLGSYVLDITKGVWESSSILDKIFGIDEKFNRTVDGWLKLIHPEWQEEMANYFSEYVLKQHHRFDKEYKIIRYSDGEERWVHGLGELEYDTDNNPVKMIGTIRDITESKKAEEELKKSFSLIEGTLESTVDGILVVDQNGKIQRFNNKFLEMWKIPESIIQTRDDDAALNFVISQLKYPAQFLNKVKELYKNVWAESIDLLEFNDGRIFERFSRPQLIGNKPVGRVWSFRDITDQKLAQEALIESERKFRTLFETSIEGILASDVEEKIILVNPRMSEISGYSADELMTMKFDDLLPPEEIMSHLAAMEERIKGKSGVYERKLRRKDGSIIWVLISASPLLDREGKYHGSFGMFTDITKQKGAEEALILAKEKAEEINRLKSIFLTNISHELRTPLIGILGYAETIYNEIEDPYFKDMALILLKSGTRLKETLNLLLDLSHIEADKLNVTLTRFSITELVREKFKQFHFAATEKGLRFQIILDESDIQINADERMVSQVIEHLLANAIKYTMRGEVTISLSLRFENQKHFVEVKVRDTGIGIPEERVRQIFEPFRQASEGLTRSFEGIGLGLTVAKKFVELMGGEIYVESSFGKGSTFTVKLPIDAASEQPSEKKVYSVDLSASKIFKECKYPDEVLLIEDDEPTANIIRIYLSEICRTDWAPDGKTAIEMAKKKNYSSLLVDINLGIGMDGIEAINKIKEYDDYKSKPIIAVTAYALHGDREKFLKQGCTHYISKPFDKEDLVELVDQVLAAKK